MSAPESHNEPTLFDPRPGQADAALDGEREGPDSPLDPASESADASASRSAKSKGKGKSKASRERAAAAEVEAEASSDAVGAEEALVDAENDEDEPIPDEDPALSDRKRLEQQLLALKRKEAELRCALVATTHPELAGGVREIQGKAYAVSKAEEKLTQGLPKSEARRQEKLDKKLAMLRTKQAELEVQIDAVEKEITELGTGRLATFESERAEAMQSLMASLGAHGEALKAAQVDPRELVADLERWWPELEAIAHEVSAEPAN